MHLLPLFYYGNSLIRRKKRVAIVGARGCTSYGRAAAGSLRRQQPWPRLEIISGMACGIDNTAQLAALRVGGTSTAVLGGAGQTSVIRLLRQRPTGSCGKMAVSCQSIRRGAAGSLAFSCPEPDHQRSVRRGACQEAREKSGSLITADLALEQGRDVYALPGRVGDALSAGCNRLIRQGAGLAKPGGICCGAGLNSLKTVNKCKKNKNSLAKEENMLYSCVDLKPKTWKKLLAESPFSAEKPWNCY